MRNHIQNRLYQRSIARRNRRRVEFIRRRNILRAQRKRLSHLSKAKNLSYLRKSRTYKTSIVFPADCRLIGNTHEVLNIIKDIQDADRNSPSARHIITLDMRPVKFFDVGALSMILAVINSIRKSRVIGNYPSDESSREYFFNSGFMDHMFMIQGKKPERKNKNNLMIERGFDKTSNKRIGEEVRKAVKHLTGRDETYRPVFSIIQEMCANSIEHANSNKNDKNWLVGICYEDKKVVFTVTDIGLGILSTLRKKVNQHVRDAFSATGPLGTLIGAFDKKYQSSTFDVNRNKGLPRIKETNTCGYIDNLKVITNDVVLTFDKPDESRQLKTKFRGTFYYFELTNEAIMKWRNRNK